MRHTLAFVAEARWLDEAELRKFAQGKETQYCLIAEDDDITVGTATVDRLVEDYVAAGGPEALPPGYKR